METAPRRNIDRAGQVARKNDALATLLDLWIGDRHGREQGFGIRVLRGCIEFIAL